MQIPKISLGQITFSVSARRRAQVCLAVGLLWACLPARAQSLLLTMRATPNPANVGDTVTYTLGLTNLTGVPLQSVTVVDGISGSGQLTGASNPFGTVTTNGNQATFGFQQLAFGQGFEMTATVQATGSGNILSSATASSFSTTNTAATNLTVQVSLPQAGLNVAIAVPTVPVFANDWMTFRVTAANGGPSDAPGVVVSNTLPAGVGLISVSPTNQAFTSQNGTVLLSLGTLTNGESRTFGLQVQPTNAGLLTFSASISASGVAVSNAANTTVSTNIFVGNFLSGQLTASNSSAMTYNPQTGLMDQKVRLSNVGTSAVASARVIVSGLTNWLYNAVGTNNGHPFVTYGAGLDPGQSVDLGMEYFVPTRLPIVVPDSAYTAVEVSATNAPLPAGTSFSVTLVTNLAPGAILIEFQSLPGRTYSILYSADSSFTNTLVAQPSIVAPADRVQWIDDGPPKTISSPADAASRFYRVILNP